MTLSQMLCKYVAVLTIPLFVAITLRAQTMPPIFLPSEIPSTAIEEDAYKGDVLTMGMSMSNSVDDNSLNDNRNKVLNVLTTVEPHFGWTGSHPRTEWSVNYRPGYSVSHQLPIYSSQSQRFDSIFKWRPMRRMTLRLQDIFLESTNPFDRLQSAEPATGSTIINRPNSAVLETARTISEQAGIDVIYATAPHSIVGASGSFFDVSYKDQAAARLLGRASSKAGQIFYNHHLSPGQWVGLDYNVQGLTAHSPNSHSLVQSVFATYSVLLSPHMVVAGFAGPEHSASHEFAPSSVTPVRRNAHWAGGATYSWSSSRSAVTGSLSRRISDGGGLAGVVRLSSVRAQVRHEFMPRWSADLLLSYDRNKTLSATATSLSYVSGACGVSHSLRPDLWIDIRYWRVHESATGNQPGLRVADHNRVSVSLVYDFDIRPGR